MATAQARSNLRPAELEDPQLVPLAAETTVLPPPIGFRATAASTRLHELLADRCTVDDRGRLSVKVADRRGPTRLSPNKSKVLELTIADQQLPILFYTKSDVWHASSAALLRGKIKGTVFEFFDADLDGSFLGANDYMSHHASAFRAVDDDRRLLLEDGFGAYDVDVTGRTPKLTVEEQPWPEWSTDQQRKAAILLAYSRQLGALPPLVLDEARCRACELHAEYLFANEYSYRTSVKKTHNQDPGLAAYSQEGAEAGRNGGIYFAADPTGAVTSLLFTMLHRDGHLGPSGPFGIGIKPGSRPGAGGTPGYTVIWSQPLTVPADGHPVVFPAPGSRGTATFTGREAPEVEDDPTFYDTQRGLAVSVHYGDLKLSDITMQLFEEERRGREPVAGRLFTHEKPIHSTLAPSNGRSAFFVADKMLATSTWFTAVFECKAEGETNRIRLEWSFETQK